MSGTTLAVTYRPLADLVPYARNARRHSPTQIQKIKASLTEFGWANAMLVAENEMIAGHARLAAALELLTEGKPIPHTADPAQGPTIDLSHLSPAQRRAYILADNRLAEEAVWDLDLLRIEFTGLGPQGDGFDLSLAGFNMGEIDTVLRGWSPDFTKHEATEAELDPLLALLRIRCLRTDLDAVNAALKKALARFDRVTIETL
jgi:ParB-like chromosome segregation protein Spo0J